MDSATGKKCFPAFNIKQARMPTRSRPSVTCSATNVPIGRRVGHQTALGAFWRKLDNQGAHVTTIEQTKLLMLAMTRKASTCSRPSCAAARPQETAGKTVIFRRALRTAQVRPVQHYDQ